MAVLKVKTKEMRVLAKRESLAWIVLTLTKQDHHMHG